MENRKATLSPVKLWTGYLHQSTTLNIPQLSNFNCINVVMERSTGSNNLTGRFYTTTVIRNSTGGFADDFGDGYSMSTKVEFNNNNTLNITMVVHQFGVPSIKEIWGIG